MEGGICDTKQLRTTKRSGEDLNPWLSTVFELPNVSAYWTKCQTHIIASEEETSLQEYIKWQVHQPNQDKDTCNIADIVYIVTHGQNTNNTGHSHLQAHDRRHNADAAYDMDEDQTNA